MFIGTYIVKTDLHARFAVPRPLYDQLEDEAEVLLVPQENQAVLVYPVDVPIPEDSPRPTRVEVDDQGRVFLPLDFMDHMGLEPGQRVRVTGMVVYFELSSPRAN